MRTNSSQTNAPKAPWSEADKDVAAAMGRDAFKLHNNYASVSQVAVTVISLWVGFYVVGAVSSLIPRPLPDTSAKAGAAIPRAAESTPTGPRAADGTLTDALIKYAIRDYGRAAELLRALASDGNAVAQLKLGEMHAAGRGVAHDEAAALQWFRRAAEQGHVEAQYRLGVALLEGRGQDKDAALGLRWLHRAAEGGVPHAMNAIGEFLLRSDQTANRTADAIVWFKCAAGMGNPTAFRNLAVLYATGSDVPQDLVEALKWYELAAAASLGAERELASRNVVAIRERTTPANVQEAKRLAQEWKRDIDAACQDLLVQG